MEGCQACKRQPTTFLTGTASFGNTPVPAAAMMPQPTGNSDHLEQGVELIWARWLGRQPSMTSYLCTHCGVVEGLQGGLGVEAGGRGQARAGHRVIPWMQWCQHRPRALK